MRPSHKGETHLANRCVMSHIGAQLILLMKTMLQSLLLILATTHSFAQDLEPINQKNLQKYFDDVAPNYIKNTGETSYRFVLEGNVNWKGRYIPLNYNEPMFRNNDEPFSVDVMAYIDQFNGQDFLESKTNFYRQQKFNWNKLVYDRPYNYLSFWADLHHPPVRKLQFPLGVYDHDFITPANAAAEHPFFDPAFQTELDLKSQTKLTRGNQMKLLLNDQSIKERIRMVREAKHYFFGAVMLSQCDTRSKDLVEEMVKAAKRGVDVRLFVEGMFMVFSGTCNKILRDGGVSVLGGSDLLKVGGVMHNKFWIKDGEEAVLGGQNLIEADNSGTGFNHMNRDTDVWVKGPAVTDLLGTYAKIWKKYDHKSVFRKLPWVKHRSIAKYLKIYKTQINKEMTLGIRGQKHYKNWLSNPDSRMDGLCRIAVQPARANRQSLGKILYMALEKSKESMYFTSPVFAYDFPEDRKKGKPALWHERIIDKAMEKATNDNFKVDFMSNGFDGGNGELSATLRRWVDALRKSRIGFLEDMVLSYLHLYNKDFTRPMLDKMTRFAETKNVKVWTYFQFTHSKVYMFDRIFTSVGSFNIDKFSSAQSQESAIYCLDNGLRDQVEEMFTLDRANSLPVFPKSVK